MLFLTAIRTRTGVMRLHGYDRLSSFYFEFTDDMIVEAYGTDPTFDLILSYVTDFSNIPGPSNFWLVAYQVCEMLDVARVYRQAVRVNIVEP